MPHMGKMSHPSISRGLGLLTPPRGYVFLSVLVGLIMAVLPIKSIWRLMTHRVFRAGVAEVLIQHCGNFQPILGWHSASTMSLFVRVDEFLLTTSVPFRVLILVFDWSQTTDYNGTSAPAIMPNSRWLPSPSLEKYKFYSSDNNHRGYIIWRLCYESYFKVQIHFVNQTFR